MRYRQRAHTGRKVLLPKFFLVNAARCGMDNGEGVAVMAICIVPKKKPVKPASNKKKKPATNAKPPAR
jgi:hypothetical protein